MTVELAVVKCVWCPMADFDRGACRHPQGDLVDPAEWPAQVPPPECPLRREPLTVRLHDDSPQVEAT